MIDLPTNLADVQRKRLAAFSCEQAVDIHCHCLPGLDDGPATLAESLALCGALVADGTTVVMATPHQLGGYEGINRAAVVRGAVERLNQTITAHGIPLRVVAGGEIRVDDQLMHLLEQDEVLTLGDSGTHLLLELPHDVMVDLRPLVRELIKRGITPIISHPERHGHICRKPDLILPWLQLGAILQVTAGSILGGFGLLAQKTAWHLLSTGKVSVVASDAHDISRRPPSMSDAIEAIKSRLGHAVARRICIENPLRIFEGAPIGRTVAATVICGGRS